MPKMITKPSANRYEKQSLDLNFMSGERNFFVVDNQTV